MLDEKCINELMNVKINCNNNNFYNHPDIVVTKDNTISVIGLLNGLFKNSKLAKIIDGNNKITKFQIVKNS